MLPQLLSCAYSYKYLEVLWLPKRTQLWACLSPTGCTEGCVHFPQSCSNTHLPHFLDCLLNTTLIPCLLVFFLSIHHERVCDYSRVQSSVAGMLRMGDMNIHITWLTHVRTGPKKKNRLRRAEHGAIFFKPRAKTPGDVLFSHASHRDNFYVF